MNIFGTQRFEKERKKNLSTNQQRQLRSFLQRLAEGDQRAKPLGPAWLKEIKIQGKRVYYIHNADTALLLAVSAKKQQQGTISVIRSELAELRKQLESLSTRRRDRS